MQHTTIQYNQHTNTKYNTQHMAYKTKTGNATQTQHNTTQHNTTQYKAIHDHTIQYINTSQPNTQHNTMRAQYKIIHNTTL